jgi:sterol 3beta-glucosyltransferase
VITILTGGTRGDTQPYIALGLELKKAGQQVRVATHENYASFVTSFGLDFYPIKGDVTQIASSDEVGSSKQADNPLKLIFSFKQLQSLVFDVQKDYFEACTGADAIVYHPGPSIGYFIAQYLKIPSILAAPFPMTPTREYPALMFYNSIRLGRSYNLLTHKVFEQVMWFAASSPVKQFWKKEFGKPPADFGCPFGKQITPSAPTIVSCSNYVFPRPADWPEDVYNSGYWFLDEEAGWRPSSDLLDFLRAGKPPVYVGFGSMADAASADKTTRLVMDALQRSGQRGILATGWNGMSNIDHNPEEIFILESAPHSWLFPQMAAVVHHGGAGTTAAGLRAGIPSIVVPFSLDQFAWGRRVHELGVGPKPIPRKQLTTEKLSTSIDFALTKPIQSTARELGAKIQSENGARSAAKVVLDCIEQQGLG